jgi:hypothetical protein
MAQLRTNLAARLLLERLLRWGPMTEPAALEMLEDRAPGRGHEIVSYARTAGMIKRTAGVDDEPATLEAVGAPSSLAA